MTESRSTPPAPTTHELYGDTATYEPSPGIVEHDNGIPVHAPRDIHEDLEQRREMPEEP